MNRRDFVKSIVGLLLGGMVVEESSNLIDNPSFEKSEDLGDWWTGQSMGRYHYSYSIYQYDHWQTIEGTVDHLPAVIGTGITLTDKGAELAPGVEIVS